MLPNDFENELRDLKDRVKWLSTQVEQLQRQSYLTIEGRCVELIQDINKKMEDLKKVR